MGVMVLMEIRSEPGRVEGVHEHLRSLLPTTAGFDGCEGITLHRQVDDDLTFVLVERWRSREHYDTYVQWRHERGDLDALRQVLSSRPSIRHFDAWSP